MTFPLTAAQQAAFDDIVTFLMDPIEPVFVLGGYSGVGKSTLVCHLLDQLPAINKTVKLLHPSMTNREVVLTATTNTAAETLAQITGQEVRTIHSFLGLRVDTDYKTGATTLTVRNQSDVKTYCLLFIDEASYVDRRLLELIFQQTRGCKIIFIGDPGQLTPVKVIDAPVFKAGFPGVTLTEVVRHDGPILELATKFRHTVETGEFFQFRPDGQAVVHLPREQFNAALIAECTRPDWKYHDSKFLAWTNKTVIAYNHLIQNALQGDPEFHIGDYAVCNRFLQVGKSSIKTDAQVRITHIGPDTAELDVPGNWVELDQRLLVFLPRSPTVAKARLKQARDNDELAIAQVISEQWADLRAAYAQTVNKSQGSTYGQVFIDLDDISRCTQGNTIARMLYVAVSRATSKVFLTGDFC